LIAVLSPIALFALIWWAWLALRLPPDDPSGRLAAGLGTAGAVAVPVGALLAWWAGRESSEHTPATPDTPPQPSAPPGTVASGERSIATGENSSGINSTGDGTINIQRR
jgi:hypothetical protein